LLRIDTVVLKVELLLFLVMSFVFSLYKDVNACWIHGFCAFPIALKLVIPVFKVAFLQKK